MSIIVDTSALSRPRFTAADFTPSKWDSAATKAIFANTLCQFIAADFKQGLFTKIFYSRLHLTYGHIACYNREGFFSTYFRDLAGKVEFLEHTLQWPCFGDPAFTYCDVEHAVQLRLRSCDLLAAYRALRAAEVEGAEREMLRRLQSKYGESPGAPEPTLIHAGRPPRQSRPPPAEQQTLF